MGTKRGRYHPKFRDQRTQRPCVICHRRERINHTRPVCKACETAIYQTSKAIANGSYSERRRRQTTLSIPDDLRARRLRVSLVGLEAFCTAARVTERNSTQKPRNPLAPAIQALKA